jgi:hypothetical protein
MKQKFIEITSKQIKVYDAQTTLKEMIVEFIINFVYGFCANIPVVFIIAKNDIGILLSLGVYYYMLSLILNRSKYTTKLGKFMIVPIAAMFGGYFSIKLGFYISIFM